MANWQEDELLLTLHLYCRTAFGKLHNRNPDVIQLANAIGRTVNAVALKATNLASLDESIPQKGMSNTSKADRALWNAFMENSTEVAAKAEALYEAKVKNHSAPANQVDEPNIPYGPTADINFLDELKTPQGPSETLRETKTRLVQNFFRRAVLTNYNHRCAISGLAIPELLVASHITPWASNEKLRANTTNGIALNALYDKAFGRHLISFDDEFRLVLSDRIKKQENNQMVQEYFFGFEGKVLEMPERFLPDREALKMHREAMSGLS